MKRSHVVLAVLSLLLPVAVGAAPGTQTTTETNQQRITNLKTRGDAEITRRLGSLNELTTKLNESAKLAQADKTAMLAQIQEEVTGLTNLKVKIDADTDLATLRTDVQSIVTEYRVYRLIVPKAAIERGADAIEEAVVRLTTYAQHLQERIDKAKANGKDVTTLQTTLTDMQAKIADAQTKAEQALTAVRTVTPDQFNASPTVVTGARDLLKQARTDLTAAHEDAKTIRQGLDAFNANPTSQSQNSTKL